MQEISSVKSIGQLRKILIYCAIYMSVVSFYACLSVFVIHENAYRRLGPLGGQTIGRIMDAFTPHNSDNYLEHFRLRPTPGIVYRYRDSMDIDESVQRWNLDISDQSAPGRLKFSFDSPSFCESDGHNPGRNMEDGNVLSYYSAEIYNSAGTKLLTLSDMEANDLFLPSQSRAPKMSRKFKIVVKRNKNAPPREELYTVIAEFVPQ